MIDIHSHIFPFIDDGSSSWNMTKSMLQQAVIEGTKEIVWTPHVMEGNESGYYEEILIRYEEGLAFILENEIKLKVHLGSEIYLTPDILKFKSEKFGTFNGDKKTILVEFPMYSYHPNYIVYLKQVVKEGYQIVIAHPERYVQLHDKKNEYEKMKEVGLYLQINAGSVRGDFGSQVEKVAKWLIQKGFADVLASDGHNDTNRPLGMKSVYDKVVLWSNKDKAVSLFENVPRLLLYSDAKTIRKELS